MLTANYIIGTAVYLLFTAYCAIPTIYCLLLTAHCSLLTAHCGHALLAADYLLCCYVLLTVHYNVPCPVSTRITYYPLPTTHMYHGQSLPTACNLPHAPASCPLLPAPYYPLPNSFNTTSGPLPYRSYYLPTTYRSSTLVLSTYLSS